MGRTAESSGSGLKCRVVVLATATAAVALTALGCGSATGDSSNRPIQAESSASVESSASGGGDGGVARFENYQLSYTSTCGDGPYITFGTKIEANDGVVTVIAGEEPFNIGSLAVWADLIEGAERSGQEVQLDLEPNGVPSSIQIAGPGGGDDDFCVEVDDFVLTD